MAKQASNTPKELDELLTIDEVAKFIKVSIKTIHRYMETDGFPEEMRLLGGGIRFHRHEVLNWLESRRNSVVKRKSRQAERAHVKAHCQAFSEFDIQSSSVATEFTVQ